MDELPTSDATPQKNPRRTLAAVIGAAVLVGVAIVAFLAGGNRDLGTLQACLHCNAAGKRLGQGWLEVPRGDAWAVQLEPGVGVVLRGPARFQVAGPRPKRRSLALSSGLLYAQVTGDAHVIVLMPRSESAGIGGASASNVGPRSLIAYAATVGGNAVEALKGKALLELATGNQTLPEGETWKSGPAPEAVPPPTAQERAWLDGLAPLSN